MTKETLKRGAYRALYGLVAGALAAFVTIPVNLADYKTYLSALAVGMIAGALMGLQKVVSGYLKYDKK
jgi:ammonia channel protein AmtB|tara:strand:- start:261 stop:464 length:204 start_codon:yes stop_codon:yes gene_type:complete